MKQQQREQLIDSFGGIKYELMILMGSILTAYAYSWLDHKVMHEQLILVMLRTFIAFADLGIFLAIGYIIEFKRGVWIFYAYKILSILSLNQNQIQTEWQYVYETVGVPFFLFLYYKITLFLLIYTASHLVQIQNQDSLLEKAKNEQQQEKLKLKHEQQDNQKLFSREERKQLYGQESLKRQEQQRQVQKTIRRIKQSLRFHKQNEFYKKLQIFYFVIYNSTCLLVLFPLQEHVIDFTKAISYQDVEGHNLLLGDAQIIDRANTQLRWVLNGLTVINVLGYCAIVMIGQFWIKIRHPELIKQYISKIPVKFFIIQLFSLATLIIVLLMTPLEQIQNNSSQDQIMLISLINVQLFMSCYFIHAILPLLIIFALYRLYLGLIYSLNHMVSKRFSFHQSQNNEETTNLDQILYQSIALNDLNKVRHFIISKDQLLSRQKLKRYTEQEKLKHYVQQQTIIEIQQMFEDFLVLDLYNKLSRWLAIWMFYLLLIVFLITMTFNDSHLVMQDKFFTHTPVLLLILGFFIVSKYESSPNIFYPKIILWMHEKYTKFLVSNKAYHFIRLNHFYAIIFSVWLYRVYAFMFLQTHRHIEEGIKLKLYLFYTDDNVLQSSLFKKLLYGWADYFTTHTAECDYDLSNIVLDTFMVLLIIGQLFMQHRFVDLKKVVKKDPILLFLRLITPLYAFYIFVLELQCLQWSRVVFCVSLSAGVIFIHLNWSELERGIQRNQEGQFDD